MSLPNPLNWLRETDSYVVFGFNRSDTLMGDWWAHRTPDHTQRFFNTLDDAKEWITSNHHYVGFGRRDEGQAKGILKSYYLNPIEKDHEKWVKKVEIIQEKFDYGVLVAWYGSRYEYQDKANNYAPKTRQDQAMWWIFQMKN